MQSNCSCVPLFSFSQHDHWHRAPGGAAVNSKGKLYENTAADTLCAGVPAQAMTRATEKFVMMGNLKESAFPFTPLNKYKQIHDFQACIKHRHVAFVL